MWRMEGVEHWRTRTRAAERLLHKHGISADDEQAASAAPSSEPRTPRVCNSLLSFADEQLGAAQHTTVNLSHIVEKHSTQNAALIVCLHAGQVLFQRAVSAHHV
jgi:hypothetical protein